jgi:3-hydroxyisobutyrate dehydrogenase-like beta-hydroxyacid dehydrogenase
MNQRVGIIGAGRIGQAMARTAQRAGRSVVISNSRGPESLSSLILTLGDGVSAGTVDRASAADIVVLAVQGGSPEQAARGGTQQAVLRGDDTGAAVPAAENAASDQGAAESTSADTLPFTGAPVTLVALLGFAALLSGVGIRRRLS